MHNLILAALLGAAGMFMILAPFYEARLRQAQVESDRLNSAVAANLESFDLHVGTYRDWPQFTWDRQPA